MSYNNTGVENAVATLPQVSRNTYRYALVNRPAGYGTVPRDLQYTIEQRPAKEKPHHDVARHGILVTERPLTDDETASFELVPLFDGDAATQLVATKIAATMGRYAIAYLQSHHDDPEVFAMQIIDRADRLRVSVADTDALIAAVVTELQAQVLSSAVATVAPAMS